MYYSRRNTKKNNAQTLESAREIAPGDTDQLNRLPLEALDQLAQEELVSTDESIRRGKEELDIAVSEFGPDGLSRRTREVDDRDERAGRHELARGRQPEELTAEEAYQLLADKRAKGPATRGGAKKPAARKAPAKKTTARKKA